MQPGNPTARRMWICCWASTERWIPVRSKNSSFTITPAAAPASPRPCAGKPSIRSARLQKRWPDQSLRRSNLRSGACLSSWVSDPVGPSEVRHEVELQSAIENLRSSIRQNPHAFPDALEHLQRLLQLFLRVRRRHDGADARFALRHRGEGDACAQHALFEQFAGEVHG